MKMANSEKAEEFVDAVSPTECLDQTEAAVTALVQEDQDEVLKTETNTTTTTTSSPTRDKELDSASQTEGEPGLLSMPCLMKELRRDSPESQQASTGSDKPVSRRVYESDSSNPCMLSPSSSGHLADSDTLSSGEDSNDSCALDQGEGRMETGTDPGQPEEGKVPAVASAGGRKSRRTRSESEMPSSAMAAKKNRCQNAGHTTAAATATTGAGAPDKQTNGRLAKVKGHRSQKHKERMRLLRQKREAAARKKYNLLQDSSTSDSELTCDSSTSSSDDDDADASGGSKTINADIPDGPPVVGHYDISDTDSNQESMSAETVRATVIRRELKAHRAEDKASGCIKARGFLAGRVESGASERERARRQAQINIASSDSEVEIVGVQENTRCAHPCGGVIKSLSLWKCKPAQEQSGGPRTSQLWTSVSSQPNCVSPPEVVDLTLDEDMGHKYLL